MSSCLSGGGGTTYGFDLEIGKSPSTSSTRTSQTSSPSSTLSESSNSQLSISTRKPRTPRKRPNQTYNEAAILLSTAYPNIFPVKRIANPLKFSKRYDSFCDDSSDLLLPFRVDDDSSFLFRQSILEKPESKVSNFCKSRSENAAEIEYYDEDFDTESILDEEIEKGIDSIMGNLTVDNCIIDQSFNAASWYGNFEFGFGLRRGIRALKRVDDDRNWWNFPTVDVLEISPKLNKVLVSSPATIPARNEKQKKKGKKLPAAEPDFIPLPESVGLRLKLNYDEVLNAWSERESPNSGEITGSEPPGNGIYVGLSSAGGKTKSKPKSKSKKP